MKKPGKEYIKETWDHIKCPYCFKEFAHNEVHFRIAEQVCKAVEEDCAGPENSLFDIFKRTKEVDPKYYEVWGDLRGGTPSFGVEDLFHIPWVGGHNKAAMIVGDYIMDEDGFVEKIEDRYAHVESRTRICPHCHNKLPLHYGKNPQKFVSILGISASGKTVFLKQLLAKLKDSLQGGILSHVNGSFVELTLPEDDDSYLTLNQPLPDSTKTLNFKIPYFVTMTFDKDNDLKTYDLVIYDVAGEILVDLATADPNKFQFFAGYIKKTDAIIMLIDPMQLVNNPVPEYPASQMITTLYNVFGNQVQIPTAITVSKSDLLLSNSLIRESLNPGGTFFNENSIITKNIPWDPAKKYFYKDEHSRIVGQLRIFYEEKANPFYTSVRQQISRNSFFAASSLFDGVDQKLTFELSSKVEWKSENIDEYIKKFTILRDKLRAVQVDLQDQEANPESNIIDKNNIINNRFIKFLYTEPFGGILGQAVKVVTDNLPHQKKIEEAATYIYKYQNKIIISDNTNTIQEAIEYMGKSDNGRKTLQNCRFVFLNYVDREKIAKLSKQYNFKYSYPKPDK